MPHESFALRSPMPVPAEAVYAWHAHRAAFLRLTPPWERIEMIRQDGTFGTDGMRVTFRTSCVGPIRKTWVVEFFDFEPGRGFKYRQVDGPFPEWVHTHRFEPNGDGGSVLVNELAYRMPWGPFGTAFASGIVRNRVEALFAYRHALTASDLRRHAQFQDRPRLKIAITGSRGLVGTDLAQFLATGGHTVVRLVSGSGTVPPPTFDDGTQYVGWNPQAPLDPAVLAGCDAVIHLAADGIADGRWTEAKRKTIVDSRTIPTRHLAEAIAALPPERRPKAFLSASAVGIYGDRGDEVLTEDAAPGTGFLADVCKKWEAATTPAAAAGVRVVHLRIGVVLTPRGGALGKQLPAFRAGVGAVLGSGKQWVPWITVHDLAGAIHHCLMTDSLTGPVNLMAPNPVQNRDFTKTLGNVLCRPAFFWLPRPALKVMFGDIADAALLGSMHAVPRKLDASGFAFDHAELEPALRFLLGR